MALPVSAPISELDDTRDVRRARTAARILDDSYVDPLLGFFLPGVGDLVGSLVGLYIVSIAIKRRLPRIVIARMLLNLALDAAFGVIPVIGDAADVAFRANKRNVALLEKRVERPETWKDWAAVMGALLLFLGVLAISVWAVIRLLQWAF